MKITLSLQYLVSGMKNRFLYSCFILIFSTHCFAYNSDYEISRKIAEIEKKSNSIMGITAIYIEKNKVIQHNSNKRFFMASTIKLPIALAFLHLVDQKKESLNRLIKMDSHNSVPGSGSLYHLFEKKQINISLQQILKYALINSDNSASDALLHAANGPQFVKKRIDDLGFKNIFINRSILEMLLDTNHVDHALLHKPQPVFVWERTFNKTPLKEKKLAWQRFEKDIRDTTTPHDMAQLLVKVYKNQALSKSSTKLLMDIMERCRTGRSRIRGMLPPGIKVAHKTGTWAITEPKYIRYPGAKKLYRFTSDVGIITLPNNKGHIAIAVYVKSRSVSDYSRSHAIALASRAIYDHFMKRS
ncbi:MAG: class A beta-lactamase [Legionella sp.]|uniref:class A beta-lactamase n=1 Tax=Legionella sp. TaxID=459 RepID=UPI0039E4A6A6